MARAQATFIVIETAGTCIGYNSNMLMPLETVSSNLTKEQKRTNRVILYACMVQYIRIIKVKCFEVKTFVH